jgi:Tol biopolymer transport system component
VFVIGTSAFAGMMLFEIDLKTGSNRKITSAYELKSGPLLFPTLSPDGSTVALLSTSAGKVLEAQVWLIDVATGRAKKLGVPFDTSKLSWLPDGRGLIAVSRKSSLELEQAVVCRLGLDGQLTELCQGASPVVLGNSPKILFDARNGDASRWMICDLNGKNAQQLGDGLPKFGFPSPSADGSQVLMMRFGGVEGPKPTMVNVATGAVKAIPAGPGLWALPAWQ